MAVTRPPLMWIGTWGGNIWHGVQTPRKLAIVAHIMAGSLAACDAWFNDPRNTAGSANYGVGKDGQIHVYVDPFGPDAPYANGLIAQPSEAVQRLRVQTSYQNPNYWTVSIEHEGQSGDVLTDAQLDASAHLAAWLCEQFGIPADEDHLLGHYEFDSVTRAHCPGWDRAGWLRWEGAIAGYLQPAPQPQPDPLVAGILTDLDYCAAWLRNPAADRKAGLKQTYDRCGAVRDRIKTSGEIGEVAA